MLRHLGHHVEVFEGIVLHPHQVIAFEYIEHLHPGDRRRGGRRTDNTNAAISGLDRLSPDYLVGEQIFLGDQAAVLFHVGDDLVAHRAAIQGFRSHLREQAIGRSEVLARQQRAGRGRLALDQELLAPALVDGQFGDVAAGVEGTVEIDRAPALGIVNRIAPKRCPWQLAAFLVHGLPALQIGRNRRCPVAAVLLLQRVIGRLDRLGRHAVVIDRGEVLLFLVPEQGKAGPGRAHHVRHHHAQRGCGGNRRVAGGAACAQRAHARFNRERMASDDHSILADDRTVEGLGTAHEQQGCGERCNARAIRVYD